LEPRAPRAGDGEQPVPERPLPAAGSAALLGRLPHGARLGEVEEGGRALVPKQAPSPARLAAMLIFALSCFGIVLFLCITFGASTPLKPKKYEVSAAFPEATTLAQEADVRISGVKVGEVRSKSQDGDRTKVVMA